MTTPARATFAWRDGEVSGIWNIVAKGTPRATLVLGHGAGGNMTTAELAGVAEGLAADGVNVLRFNFPYAEAGRKAPDKQEKLEACYWAVAKTAAEEPGPLYLGGRSMGGRIATHIVADGFPAAGLALIAYPLHPPGRPEKIRDAHLRRIAVPMLFLSGTRDSFATPELLEDTVKGLNAATLRWFEGGSHSLKVPGRTAGDVTAEIVSAIIDWIGGEA